MTVDAELPLQQIKPEQAGHKQSEDNDDNPADDIHFIAIVERQLTEGGGTGPECDQHARESKHKTGTEAEDDQTLPGRWTTAAQLVQ